ncbi:hypothetical protein TVAG_465530 [Trichomonas vaginalis G3]|uniref:Uncharacterized protein n=1 Tax=Trichomonas vaginalis (strain ATCC PRA-98 / G3) TaxID=412133 RepID=A2DU18_TRIV3|nr:hypothetical protein TVAGG3_0718240 [Trichomonas vaginalis G3]EAY16165.1 hypothetical protein TVAG_465530 [Trichomonas vaginalis G3]KAI5510401.1 hypothetical protein TVAGG3_0718240 [Trichomonas vaginalis G3]|eukprot:XP_001328388.1 hypothetical protein [Trichomonas vaginalis G3]
MSQDASHNYETPRYYSLNGLETVRVIGNDSKHFPLPGKSQRNKDDPITFTEKGTGNNQDTYIINWNSDPPPYKA